MTVNTSTGKKAYEIKNGILWNMVLEKISMDTWKCPKDERVSPEGKWSPKHCRRRKWQSRSCPTPWDGRVLWKRQQRCDKQKTAAREGDRLWDGRTTREKPQARARSSRAGPSRTGPCGPESLLAPPGVRAESTARNTPWAQARHDARRRACGPARGT